MKENGKLGQNISIGQIMTQFWNGVRPMKNWFIFSYIFFFCAQIINIIVPLYYKDVFDILGKSTDPASVVSGLNKVIFIILLLHLGNQLFWQAGTYFFTKMQSSVMARLKQNAFNYMIDHSYTFFANNFSGSLVQRVGRFSRAFEALTDSVAF